MFNKNRFGTIFFILSIIYIAIVTVTSFTQMSIWFDEIFSINLVSGSFNEMIGLATTDIHPVLFYLIFFLFKKIFSIFNFTDLVAIGRFVVIIPFYLLIIFSYTVIKEEFDYFTAGLFAFLIVSMPSLMFFAVEVRMYSWALLFLTMSFVYMYKIIYKPYSIKNWVIFTILSIASSHTHYFATVASVGVYLVLLAYIVYKKRELFKYWIVSTIVCICAFLPWLLNDLDPISLTVNRFWVEPITLKSIVQMVYFVFGPYDSYVAFKVYIEPSVLGTLMIIAFLAVIVYDYLRKRDCKFDFSMMGFVIFLFVPIVGFIISYIYIPIFYLRYLIPAIGIFWLSFAILVRKIYDNKKLLYPILILLLVVSAVSTYDFVGAEVKDHEIAMNTTKVLNESFGENNIIISDFFDVNARLEHFYTPNNNFYLVSHDGSFNQVNETALILNDSKVRQMVQDGAKVYYIDRFYDTNEQFVNSEFEIKKFPYLGGHVSIPEINENLSFFVFEIDMADYYK